jgi:acetyl-CoA carboxylase biotin carboxylase subunit
MSPYSGFKVLVANRGEIALRILRTCRELGMPSVAVYSDADEHSLHARYADEAVRIGPADSAGSYLNISAVIDAAVKSGARAVHPGYGFLSENPEFARAVQAAGRVFRAPRPEPVALTGEKLAARRVAREAGLPVLPGPDEPLNDGPIDSQLSSQVVFPVLIKAVAGGGGRGIRLANDAEELEMMIEAARKEALAAFGNDAVYFEPLVQGARHIEVQVIGDGEGRILCLGERECSIQRRRQKLIEEAPAPRLPETLRRAFHAHGVRLAEQLRYRSLGTVEFLLDQNGAMYFIEVNPRIQVEHPVTEMVMGVDLVREQLLLAASGKLHLTELDMYPRGAAIEARVLAEDASLGFLPATGEIAHLLLPAGPGIRVDTGLYLGMPVSADYDSLLAKVIVWDESRNRAVARMKRALEEFQIGGVPTDLDFLHQIVSSRSFRTGRTDTTYLDHFSPAENPTGDTMETDLAAAVALLASQEMVRNEPSPKKVESMESWKYAAWRGQMRG